MANTFVTPSAIAKETLMQLENMLVMANNVERDYIDEFKKVGDTVSIRKPVQFTTTESSVQSIQDITEKTGTLSVLTQAHVSWDWSMVDWSLKMEKFSERYIQPAAISLSNTIDSKLCALYKKVYHASGTAGTTPSAFSDIKNIRVKMENAGIPNKGQLKLVVNPDAKWTLADGLKGAYSEKLVTGILETGYLRELGDLKIYGDQNIFVHTAGVPGGTPLVNGASQSVTYASLTNGANIWSQTLNVDGLTVSTGNYKEGDLITIAGVNSVNPVSKQSTGVLQDFTILADATANGSGQVALTISPPIIVSGAYQTVTAAPADNAAVTLKANHTANLAFHKNAFALVTYPMALPDSATFKARESYNGLSVNVVKAWDQVNYRESIRLDILFGVGCVDPRLAARLLG